MLGCLGLDCLEGLGVVRPPCKWYPACDAALQREAIYRKQGDRFAAYGHDKIAKQFYAMADKDAAFASNKITCCKDAKRGPGEKEEPFDWKAEREKYRMTPEELEKAKDVYRKGFEETKARYQKMIDEGKSYHGMTPAQLKKWILLDGPAKLEKRLKELEKYPYKPQYAVTREAIQFGGPSRQFAIPTEALDFSIDKKPKAEAPKSWWSPYSSTVPAPSLTPAETPEPSPSTPPRNPLWPAHWTSKEAFAAAPDCHQTLEGPECKGWNPDGTWGYSYRFAKGKPAPVSPPAITPEPSPSPTPSPKPGCGTFCTLAVGNNTCVNTCTGERWKTDAKDHRITPSPASPAVTPSVRPAISPALKTTIGRTAMSGLGCIGLGCMGAMTESQRTKAMAMLGVLRHKLAMIEAF